VTEDGDPVWDEVERHERKRDATDHTELRQDACAPVSKAADKDTQLVLDAARIPN
jgi:hypothetical protein